MPLSERRQGAQRWLNAMTTAIEETSLEMIQPYPIQALYPVVEKLRNGEWVQEQSIFPHQQKFHDARSLSGKRAAFRLFTGGVGSGKSVAASAEVVSLLHAYPKLEVCVTSAYDYFFDEFVWPTFQKVLPFDDPFVESVNLKTRSLWLRNGSHIFFKAFDDPDKVKGFESHILWIEEASELGDGNSFKARALYSALLMRLRAPPQHYPREVILTQNPKGHNWVWRVFIKDNPLGDLGKETRIAPCEDYPQGFSYFEYERVAENGDLYYTIRTGSDANRELPSGYIDRMLQDQAQNPEVRRRMVEGAFNPINTLVYEWPIFSESTHVVALEEVLLEWEWDRSDGEPLRRFPDLPGIPRFLPVYVGIDVGGPRSPWAVLMYVEMPDQTLVCIDEYYQRGVTWDEAAEAILSMTSGWLHVTYWIDPYSAPQKQGASQESVLEIFAKYGIACQLPKGYNKQTGILQVQNLLHRDKNLRCPYLKDEWDQEAGQYEIGTARLYYLAGACPYNLKEKEVWRYDVKKAREPKEAEEGLSAPVQEKPVDRDDHAQTAEIFAIGGYSPFPRRRSARRRDAPEPTVRYKGRSMRRA